jgi:hypothetical protein
LPFPSAWRCWAGRCFDRVLNSPVVFVFSALATIPTYLTGEPAEDAIEGVAGAIEPWIEPHEEAALVSLILGEALGVLWATPASRATGTFSAIASPCRFRREVCNSR